MQNDGVKNILRWGTAIMLAASGIFFFMPYGLGVSGFKLTEIVFKLGDSDMITECLFRFVAPIVLTVVAGVGLMVKGGKGSFILAAALSGVAAGLYAYALKDAGGFSGFDTGFKANIVIAFAGVALSVVNIVIRKND